MELCDESGGAASSEIVASAYAEWISEQAEWESFVTLTFASLTISPKAALRRLRYKLKKIRFEGEYLAVAEGERWVRSHVHALVVGEIDPEALSEAWGMGDVQVKKIYDRAGVSRYMAEHIQRGGVCSDF